MAFAADTLLHAFYSTVSRDRDGEESLLTRLSCNPPAETLFMLVDPLMSSNKPYNYTPSIV